MTVSTDARPKPTLLAELANKKKVGPVVTTPEPKQAPIVTEPKPHTSQSAGYAPKRVLPTVSVPKPPQAARKARTDEWDDAWNTLGWGNYDSLATPETLGVNTTSRLRRSTNIDPVDPTEANDLDFDFVGFRIV